MKNMLSHKTQCQVLEKENIENFYFFIFLVASNMLLVTKQMNLFKEMANKL